ncbi:MAG: tetratricopeptide repeat protein [Fibromonadaceae bacterium]|jgi:tetratricopeptide (TPR) repeat protein|nr:tetratricopeptide repeat protein [Fibromonadaceae bacterium]
MLFSNHVFKMGNHVGLPLILIILVQLAFAQTQSVDQILNQANVLYGNGRYLQAILLYRKAEERGANPVTTSFNTANSLFQMNKFPEAAAAYRKAVNFSDGEFAPALANLAAVLYRIGEYPESIALYRRALSLDPGNASAWIYLAEAYQKTGDNVGALQAIEKARQIDSADVSLVYQQSEIHIAMEEFDIAANLVRQAYSKNPEERDFLIYLGDIYRLNKNFSESISAYREALALRPNDRELLYKLADCLAEDEKPYLAIDVLNQIVQMDSSFTDAAIFLGNLAFETNWLDRAESAYLLAGRRGNNEAVYGLQNIVYEYVQKKRIGEAKQTIKKILELYPKNAELRAEFNSILEGE